MSSAVPSAPTSSPLTCRVPPEIHLEIFRFCLRHDCTLGRYSYDPYREDEPEKTVELDHHYVLDPSSHPGRVNTALFTVCRKISLEARAAFFKVNVIRVRLMPMWIAKIQDLRHLELARDAAFELCCNNSKPLDYICRLLTMLPKLRTITVLCNALPRSDTTVRSLISGSRSSAREVDLQCVDIGLFEIAPVNTTVHGKIYFDHRDLRTMPAWVADLAGKTRDEIETMQWEFDMWHVGSKLASVESASIDCALLLHYYELIKVARTQGLAALVDLLEPGEDDIFEFFNKSLRVSDSIPWKSAHLPDEVKLFDLVVGDPACRTSELLERATELLSLNVYTGTTGDD